MYKPEKCLHCELKNSTQLRLSFKTSYRSCKKPEKQYFCFFLNRSRASLLVHKGIEIDIFTGLRRAGVNE